jgi:hypothetical protein
MTFIGKHVQILLQNNMILEGTVIEWSPHQVVISSLDDESTSVILHPKEDIRVVKIIGKQNAESVQKPEATEKKKIKLEQEFDETYQMPSDNNLRLKKLAELKSELIEQEKLMIASRLKEHTIGDVKTVKYEQPRFFKKQSSE